MPEVTDKKEGGSYAILPLECKAHDNFQIFFHHSSSPPSCVIFFFQSGWLVSLLDGCLRCGVCRRKFLVNTEFRKSAFVCVSLCAGLCMLSPPR